MRRILLLLMCLVLVVGCVPSMNIQRAGLRSAGDLGVTACLDAVPAEAAGPLKAEIESIAESILVFLDTGAVAALTHSELRTKLEELVPVKYRSYFDAVLSAVSDRSVDVDKIGANNVKRLRAGAVGIVAGCTRYDKEDRPAETEDNASAEPVPGFHGTVQTAEDYNARSHPRFVP